jgi:hypothetical protein
MQKIYAYPALKSKYIFIITTLLFITHCIWSYQLQIAYPMSDLHYRIIGSRLLHSNLSPYFYQWHIGDNILFYDKNMFLPDGVNGVTVTPFLLWLHNPLASLDFCTAKFYWWMIDELFFFGTLFFTGLLANKLLPQLLSIVIFVFFYCFSNLWIFSIWVGQCYIVYAFIFSLASWLMIKQKNEKIIYYLFPFAILIRPFFSLAFVPFLLSNFLKNKIHFVAGVFISFLFFIFSGSWKVLPEYSKAMTIYAKEQLQWKPNNRQKQNDVNINYDCVSTNNANTSIKGNAGLYSLQHYLQIKGYPIAAQLFYMIILIVLLAVFLLAHRNKIFASSENLIMASFLIYMLCELLAPAIRQGYNLIQYAGIIGVIFYCNKRMSITLLIAGIIMNSQLSRYWGYAAEAGEILILLSLYSCLVLKSKKQSAEYSNNPILD